MENIMSSIQYMQEEANDFLSAFQFDEPDAEVTDPVPDKICLICNNVELGSSVTFSTCKHKWCDGCLRHLFHLSIRDRALFPPKCCSKIRLDGQMRKVLGRDLTTKFLAKAAEFNETKIFCSELRCTNRKSLQHSCIKDGLITCPTCQTSKCAKCQRQPHDGKCEYAVDDTLLIALARDNYWAVSINTLGMQAYTYRYS
jgi:hypothetical protein